MNRVSLPLWFDPANYGEAINFSARDWHWHLSARAALWNYVSWGASPSYLYERSKSNPQADNSFRFEHGCASLLKAVRSNPSLTSDDLDHTEFISQHLSIPSSVMSVDAHRVKELQIEENELLVKVRIDLPERLLIKNFTTWLRIAKKEKMLPDELQRFRTPNFGGWHRVGLLPYLDLRIWEIEEDKGAMTLLEMADAVFVDCEIGNEETIRKTTAPLAEQVIDGNLLGILASLSTNP